MCAVALVVKTPPPPTVRFFAAVSESFLEALSPRTLGNSPDIVFRFTLNPGLNRRPSKLSLHQPQEALARFRRGRHRPIAGDAMRLTGSPRATASGQSADFLIEVDQILAALVVQCFEDESSQFAVAHELTPATPWAHCLAHETSRMKSHASKRGRLQHEAA
jgi:hypothetical protein